MDTSKVTRVLVADVRQANRFKGVRSPDDDTNVIFESYSANALVALQDDGKTLKVFIMDVKDDYIG